MPRPRRGNTAFLWGDVVRQDSTLYLAVYEWPSDGKLYLPGLKSEIASAGICDGQKTLPVSFEKRGNWTVLDVPYKKPDNLVSVIALAMKGGEISVDNTQAVDPESGIDELSVVFADASGCNVSKTSWMVKFGEWKHKYCTPDLNRGGKVNVDGRRNGTSHIQCRPYFERRRPRCVESGDR